MAATASRRPPFAPPPTSASSHRRSSFPFFVTDSKAEPENSYLRPPNFDYIARPYRWLEYLTLGRALERCRLHFLPQLSGCTQALVFGDGDGRFLAALLAQNPFLAADAVDTSAAMLNLLRIRCERTAPNCETRLVTHQIDALTYLAAKPLKTCDLVVTHFFLDCLTQSEVESLAAAISGRLAPEALWLVSDFRVPSGVLHHPAKLLILSLYLAFRVLTGLRTKRLPDHASALAPFFTRTSASQSLFGLLTTELWTALPLKQSDIPKSVIDPTARLS